MIVRVTSFEPYAEFIGSFEKDSEFSDPHIKNDERNLYGALELSDREVFAVTENERTAGLFVFMILPEERYAEMLVGLSRSESAYSEMLDFITRRCGGCKTDFVFNPKNLPLRRQLEKRNAVFDKEQVKMTLKRDVPFSEKHNIEPYDEKYREQYLLLHGKDVYWTGEKVLDASDRFRVFLAVEDEKVLGYIDVTFRLEENEIYDMKVADGLDFFEYARALVSKAVGRNRPKGMTVLLDADDAAAAEVYMSAGFDVEQGCNSVYACIDGTRA